MHSNKTIFKLEWSDIKNTAENEEIEISEKDFEEIKGIIDKNIDWYNTIVMAITEVDKRKKKKKVI